MTGDAFIPCVFRSCWLANIHVIMIITSTVVVYMHFRVLLHHRLRRRDSTSMMIGLIFIIFSLHDAFTAYMHALLLIINFEWNLSVVVQFLPLIRFIRLIIIPVIFGVLTDWLFRSFLSMFPHYITTVKHKRKSIHFSLKALFFYFNHKTFHPFIYPDMNMRHHH